MSRNSYPEKPMVRYVKTQVAMPDVIDYLKSIDVNLEIKRAAYIMFRNESANGKSGINNNYAGIQADSGRWPEKYDSAITGVVKLLENGTRMSRLFVQFSSWRISVDMLLERVASRGLYIGGFERLVTKKRVIEQTTLSEAYRHGWISWPASYTPGREEENESFLIVCLAIAYKRSWVTGNSTYLPSRDEVLSFRSMYMQAKKFFS